MRKPRPRLPKRKITAGHWVLPIQAIVAQVRRYQPRRLKTDLRPMGRGTHSTTNSYDCPGTDVCSPRLTIWGADMEPHNGQRSAHRGVATAPKSAPL